MRKLDIDALTLRYFPGIGNRWVRYLVALVTFFPYAYLIFPLKNLAGDKLKAITVVMFFILFVMADSSYLTRDISRTIDMPHAVFEGVMNKYEGRRGLGTSHIVVSGTDSKRFKLLTVRGKGSHQYLEKQIGKKMRLGYIEASGLLTRWELPVSIRLSTGEKIYDYRDYPDWFEDPTLPVDRILILLFKSVALFSILFFPLNCVYRLLGQEVQHELDQQGGTERDNSTES